MSGNTVGIEGAEVPSFPCWGRSLNEQADEKVKETLATEVAEEYPGQHMVSHILAGTVHKLVVHKPDSRRHGLIGEVLDQTPDEEGLWIGLRFSDGKTREYRSDFLMMLPDSLEAPMRDA